MDNFQDVVVDDMPYELSNEEMAQYLENEGVYEITDELFKLAVAVHKYYLYEFDDNNTSITHLLPENGEIGLCHTTYDFFGENSDELPIQVSYDYQKHKLIEWVCDEKVHEEDMSIAGATDMIEWSSFEGYMEECATYYRDKHMDAEEAEQNG